MNVKSLKRDAAKVKGYLRKLDIKDSKGLVTDTQTVTTKGCKIMIPVRYAEHNLATLGSQIYICGIYAIIVEDLYYAISITNAMMRIKPSSTDKVDVDDEPYYVFTFDPGSVVIDSNALVKKDVLVYEVYSEMISKGRVPWFLGYLEMSKLFESAKKFAGVNIGDQPEVDWLLISLIARDPKNIGSYYRSTIQSMDDLVKNPPIWTPLQKVSLAATNTFTKIGGNYFKDGVRSALVNPSTRTERIETILTK